MSSDDGKVFGVTIKRPGEYMDDVTPSHDELRAEPDKYSESFTEDQWGLGMPHQCDAWVIGGGTLAEVLESARAFRAELDVAISVLEAEVAGARAM